jgi:DNA-binding response OmpR family regulator
MQRTFFGSKYGIMTDKARILVIEDEPGVSMMAVYLLTQAGCEVQAAWNEEKGMQLAQTGGFNLITMNVNLPSMNGFEICRRLKQNPRQRDTPVVFVSECPSEEDQQYAFELGAVDYITKPFDAQDFVSRILSHVSDNNDFGLVEAIPENSMV